MQARFLAQRLERERRRNEAYDAASDDYHSELSKLNAVTAALTTEMDALLEAAAGGGSSTENNLDAAQRKYRELVQTIHCFLEGGGVASGEEGATAARATVRRVPPYDITRLNGIIARQLGKLINFSTDGNNNTATSSSTMNDSGLTTPSEERPVGKTASSPSYLSQGHKRFKFTYHTRRDQSPKPSQREKVVRRPTVDPPVLELRQTESTAAEIMTRIRQAPAAVQQHNNTIVEGYTNKVIVVPPLHAVFIRNCVDCVVLCLPTKGSVFIEDCQPPGSRIENETTRTAAPSCDDRRTILYCACHQFRSKDCRACDFYVACRSNPVIEGCRELRFGGYEGRNGLWERHLLTLLERCASSSSSTSSQAELEKKNTSIQASKHMQPLPPVRQDIWDIVQHYAAPFGAEILNNERQLASASGTQADSNSTRKKRRSFEMVQDFDWVKAGPSPNWSSASYTHDEIETTLDFNSLQFCNGVWVTERK